MNPPLLDAADSAADESRVAGALARRGLHTGDRLALSLPGSSTYLSVVLGALRSGLAPFPLARPMHMTSGTTGQPKGVWSGILSPEHAGALVAEERELWGFIESDVNLVVAPIYHSAPLRFAIGTLLVGGSVAVLDHFDAAEFSASVDELRPTTMFCVPAQLQRLFAWLDETGSAFDASGFASLPMPARRVPIRFGFVPTTCSAWSRLGVLWIH